MTNAQAAHASIVFGADAKNPLLARTMTKMAQTLLEKPLDEFDSNDNTSIQRVMTDVLEDMIDEAVDEMTAIAEKYTPGSVEEQLGMIFSRLS